MKTTDLFDARVPAIKTQGLDANTYGFCKLRIDVGFGPEDPDHSRGYVRLELDRETAQGGGIATHVLRASAFRDGELKDVLELHTLGDCETAALARALIFAGKRLLAGLRPLHAEDADGAAGAGVLHDSPYGSVWQEAK